MSSEKMIYELLKPVKEDADICICTGSPRPAC